MLSLYSLCRKAGEAAQDYRGGRDYNSLAKHVQDKLAD
jgi:hypothetical protein